jgi:putative membrane protein
MMGWYGGGMGAGAWMFMGVFWLVLLGLIIWAVVRLLPGRDSGAGGRGSGAAAETPEEILDRRFARGEIDLETYQTQRAALVSARGKR